MRLSQEKIRDEILTTHCYNVCEQLLTDILLILCLQLQKQVICLSFSHNELTLRVIVVEVEAAFMFF